MFGVNIAMGTTSKERALTREFYLSSDDIMKIKRLSSKKYIRIANCCVIEVDKSSVYNYYSVDLINK